MGTAVQFAVLTLRLLRNYTDDDVSVNMQTVFFSVFCSIRSFKLLITLVDSREVAIAMPPFLVLFL